MKKFLQAFALSLTLLTASVSFAQTSGQAPAQTAAQGNERPVTPVEPGQPRKDWSFRDAGLIPVQSNGRIKPLDTFAREIVLFETGSRSFEGWDPVDLIFSWITAPREWENHPFIQISRLDVKRQLGLDEKRNKFSPKEIYADSFLAQYAEGLGRPNGATQSVPIAVTSKPDPRDQELRRLVERIGMYRGLISGDGWPVIPTQAPAPWLNLNSSEFLGKFIRSQYAVMLTAHLTKNKEVFDQSVLTTRAAVESEIPAFENATSRMLRYEVIYNRVNPFLIAWICYLIAALLWGAVRVVQSQRGSAVRKFAGSLTAFALFMHIAGITFRCLIAGRPPVTNMYESIIWVSLGVMIFATILYLMHRQAVLFAVSCTLATLGLVAAAAAPAMMDPGIHPLVPVLRSNYWLTIHVLTITLGYAAFALTLGIGNVTLFQFFKRDRDTLAASAKIHGLNQLTYRAMQFGVVLLAAGTILGGIWADYSWGRFWGWDPKEVWALIALLGYLVVLHARFTGWMRQFGFAACTVVAFVLVVMAWYGVNFVLGVGLHSYGFASGGYGWVLSFVLGQMAYVLAAAYAHFRIPSPTVAVPQ
ncbi:MAG: cytochrome c biogenesis protein CcsA [Methylotenera sp.]|nr:cytochrome c biogenesis protein CcsA [Oligoflexia bacterium]